MAAKRPWAASLKALMRGKTPSSLNGTCQSALEASATFRAATQRRCSRKMATIERSSSKAATASS
eukprot:12392292-Alexandrium_andersonii.AAC.1